MLRGRVSRCWVICPPEPIYQYNCASGQKTGSDAVNASIDVSL